MIRPLKIPINEILPKLPATLRNISRHRLHTILAHQKRLRPLNQLPPIPELRRNHKPLQPLTTKQTRNTTIQPPHRIAQSHPVQNPLLPVNPVLNEIPERRLRFVAQLLRSHIATSITHRILHHTLTSMEMLVHHPRIRSPQRLPTHQTITKRPPRLHRIKPSLQCRHAPDHAPKTQKNQTKPLAHHPRSHDPASSTRALRPSPTSAALP